MDATHLHLVLNHVPVLGIPMGIVLLLAGLWRRSADLRVAGLLVFVFCAAVAVGVFLTGEPAEERVEALPGVGEAVIHDHEEAAEIAIWGALALGAVAGASILLHMPRRLGSAGSRVRGLSLAPPLVLGLLVAGMMFRTAYLGGQIRHTEIRSASQGTPDAPAKFGAADEDD